MSYSSRVTRLTFMRRTLLLCFYPVLTVIGGNAILLGLEPAREALQAFQSYGDTPRHLWQNETYWLFMASLGYWAMAAWYCARLLLGRRFRNDAVGECVSHPFAAAVNTWTPRALGLLCGVPITVYFALPGSPPGAWILPAILSVVFLALVVARRPLVNRIAGWPVLQPKPYARRQRTARASVVALLMMFAVSGLVLAAVLFGQEQAARSLGAPVLLLFGFGSWTLFGSIVLVYLPKSAGLPSLTLLPFYVALLASPWNENHIVADRGQRTALEPRPTLADDFARWQALRGSHADEPVYLVAAAGGASRAAYWTGTLLAELETLARKSGTRFSGNVYAMSGVSGGSLGIAAFAGALAVPGQPWERSAGQLDAFLRQDYLAPLVGYLLYPDMLARFSPLPCPACDRSLALERTWQREWARQVPGNAAWFTRSLPSLNRLRASRPFPNLVFNTTSASEGERVVQSNLAFTPPQAHDLLDPSLATAGLTLAEAVHNSARFPYLSPAGLVFSASHARWDYLVDGGYFENSGAATLNAMIDALVRSGLVRPEQLVVLVIENEPARRSQWICPAREHIGAVAEAEASRTLSVGPSFLGGHKNEQYARHVPAVPELSLPFYALFQTHNARARVAEDETARLLGPCACGRLIELRYPWTRDGKQPPLSWFLNNASTRAMSGMLARAPRGSAEIEAFQRNWARISALVQRKARPGDCPAQPAMPPRRTIAAP